MSNLTGGERGAIFWSGWQFYRGQFSGHNLNSAFQTKINAASSVASLKEQGGNGFRQINMSFNFCQINHRPLAIMDGFNKCCEIKTVSSRYELLQVLP